MSRKITDLTNNKFGELVVVGFYGYQKPDSKKDRKPSWVCRCSCGKEVIVRSSSLNCKNHTSSCFDCARKTNGLKYSNLIGKRFGRLVVISKAEKPDVKNGSQYWNVVCDCGNEKIVSTNPLKKGTTVSCGCFNKENTRNRFTKHGLSSDYKKYNKLRRSDPVEKLKHIVGCSVREKLLSVGKIKKRSTWLALPYTPQQLRNHLESLWEPWMNWDNYGGRSNDERKTWWIDHIKPQSSFLYESVDDELFLQCWALSNLRPREKRANTSKGDKIL